jgi:hypothetical protein
MEAATEVGAQQLMLGDLPADITQRKLADSMFEASQARFAGALVAVAGAVAAALTDVVPADVPDVALVGAGVAAAAALLAPVVLPFVEIYNFSGVWLGCCLGAGSKHISMLKRFMVLICVR